MGHQLFCHCETASCLHGNVGLTLRGIYTFDLHRIHSKHRILPYINICYRIQNPGSRTFSFPVMFLLIMDNGILANMKCVNPVVPCIVASRIMDTASGNDIHIRPIFNIKIIVDNVGHSGGGDNHRNVYRLPICILVNINVNSLLVFFFTDLDMLTVPVADGDSVFPEIESSLLFKSFSVDHMKYFFCNFIQYHFSHLLPSYNAASR